MKRWTVYCHTHIATGRRYVGLTSKTMLARWNDHVYKSKSSKGGRWHFPNAIHKYGKNAFSHDVIGVFDSLEEANRVEAHLIEEWSLQSPECGFNLAKGGEHNPHPIRKNPWNDPEYRAKQLARSTDHLHTPEAYAKRIATESTPEFKAKQSAISKEVHSRPEVKAKESAASKGRVMSSETRAKVSRAVKGRILSQETRAKIGTKNFGRKHTAESKLKMHLLRLGKKNSPEASKKVAERNRRYVVENGQITYKKCRIHGLVRIQDCWVGKLRNGEPRVMCKECVRRKS